MTENQARRHVFSGIVSNEHSVLARIHGLFSRCGWNIESQTVARTTSSKYKEHDGNGGVSRLTIVAFVTDEQAVSITAQIDRLVPVYEIRDITDSKDKVEADASLVKVLTDNPYMQTMLALMGQTQFRAMSVRTKPDFIVLRFVGQEGAASDFVEAVKRFNVEVETGHTGIVAID